MAGGSPKTASTQSVSKKTYSPEEEALRQKLLSEGNSLYGSTGEQLQQFSPDTLAAQQGVRDYAATGGGGTADAAQRAVQFGLSDVLYPETNPALQATIDTATRQVGQAYTDPGGVLSNIRGNSIMASGPNQSTREGIASGIAARSYLDTVGDVSGRIASAGYGQGLNTFNQTLGFTPQMMNMMLQPSLAQGAVGQQIEQRQIEAPWANLQNYSNFLNTNMNPTVYSSGTAPVGSSGSPLGSALAGASMGFMMGGGPWGAAIGAGAGLLMGSR